MPVLYYTRIVKIMVKQSFGKSSKQNVIRRIALVGGFADFRDDAEHPDHKFVTMTNDYLNRSGMRIADDVDIDVVNFVNGREFLQEDKKYDAVYIAFIPRGINMSHTRMSFNTYSEHSFDGTDTHAVRDKSRNTIAPDNSPTKWVERIIASKAKIIAVRSGCIEVDLNYFQKSPSYGAYKTLLSPNQDAAALYRGASDFGREDVKKLYGAEVDVPFQWLGVAATKSYLKKISDSLEQSQTSLARRALDIINEPKQKRVKISKSRQNKRII